MRESAAVVCDLSKSPKAGSLTTEDGWTIQLEPGVDTVVARKDERVSYEVAFHEGMSAIQKSLDLLSVLGHEDFMAKNPEQSHYVLWNDQGSSVLRIYVQVTIRVSVTGTGIATNAAGQVLPQPAPPAPPSWDESFRYFRLSQLTDDLFDAFRNLFLALESILSSLAPVSMKANGRPAERERAWLSRALTAAGSIANLTQFVPAGTVDPVAGLVALLYDDVRCKVAHGKKGPQTLLPQSLADRRLVEERLQLLARLYLLLVEAHLGLRRLGGGFNLSYFNSVVSDLASGSSVMLSDCGEQVTGEEESPAVAGSQTLLPGVSPTVTSSRGFNTLFARLPVGQLSALDHVGRIGLVDSGGTPIVLSGLGHPLKVSDVDFLELEFGIRLHNAGQPKLIYAA